MSIVSYLKKNKVIPLVVILYAIVFVMVPSKGAESVSNSVYYLIEMIQVLPIIFMLTVVIEAWVPKEVIMRGFGENSGIKGNILSIILGSISAGPIYAAFPIGKSLLKKGASVTNIVIILRKQIYSPANYYRRVRTQLRALKPPEVFQPLDIQRFLSFFRAGLRLGILGKERFCYWQLILWTLVRRPRLISVAVTLSIYGYHYRKICERYIF